MTDELDPDDIAALQGALEDSNRVDARRITLNAEGDEVVLRGAVATPEEASAATLIIEQLAPSVRSELEVDHGLREGATEPVEVENAVPAEDEVLVGDPDMLAGPDADIETDLSHALEENVAWDPPTEPQLAGSVSEYRSHLSDGGSEGINEGDPELLERARDAAAPDLSAEDLRQPASQAPSLDEQLLEPSSEAQPDPLGVEELGDAPPEHLEPMVDQVPGTEQGPGAVAESTTEGGSTGSLPATETGARGADTAAADPVRSTGRSLTDPGTERGPQGRDDEALRENFPERE
jgi:hypothetical protein